MLLLGLLLTLAGGEHVRVGPRGPRNPTVFAWAAAPPRNRPLRPVALNDSGLLSNRAPVGGCAVSLFVDRLATANRVRGVAGLFETPRALLRFRWQVSSTGFPPVLLDDGRKGCRGIRVGYLGSPKTRGLRPAGTGGVCGRLADGER